MRYIKKKFPYTKTAEHKTKQALPEKVENPTGLPPPVQAAKKARERVEKKGWKLLNGGQGDARAPYTNPILQKKKILCK